MENTDRHLDDTTRKLRLITFLGFLFGFSVALVSYIGSSYYALALGGTTYVGLLYIISFSLLLVTLLNMHKALMRWGRGRSLMMLLVAQVGLLLLLVLLPVSYFTAAILALYYIIYGVIWVLWDAVLEAYSTDETTGRVRGMFLAVWGIGAIIGPAISLYVVDNYGFSMIFTIVMVLYVLMASGTMIALRDIRGHVQRRRMRIADKVKELIAQPALRYAYWIATTLGFFYATMVVFMPLKLTEIGFSFSEMGVLFTIMLIPFMLTGYPAGLIADRWLGEKELFFVGMLILIGSVVVAALVDQKDFALWATILFFSRFGGALIEAMRDSYFYKHIDGEDVAMINLFRTSRSVAYVLAMLVATAIQVVAGMNAVFITMIFVLLSGLYPIARLKDTK